MAAVPAPNMPAPRQPTASYAAYFTDNSKDIFNGNYREVLAPYSVNIAGVAVAPAVVRDLATNAKENGIPTAFIQAQDNGQCQIMIQLDKISSRLGLPDNQWTGRMFVQHGDLVHNQSRITELPDAAFNAASAVRVGLPATIQAALAGDPDLQVMEPFAPDDAAAEVVRSRKICFLPPPFVPALLAGPITARQAWTIVYDKCVAEGWEESCAPLLNYLRCALTRTQVGNPPIVWETPSAVPLTDEFMIQRRLNIVQQDFPELDPSLQGLQQNAIAEQVGGLRMDFQTKHLAEAARREQEKNLSVLKKFGPTTLASLLKICNVQTEEELPGIYKAWAKESKAQHLVTLQQALNNQSIEFQEGGLQIIPTASLLNVCMTAGQKMVDNNAVLSGLNPFRTHEHNDEEKAMAAVTVYSMIHGGGGTPTLDDARNITMPTAVAPLLLYQARQQVKRLEIYVAVCQGATHPLTLALAAYSARFMAMEGKLQTLMMKDEPLLPSLLMKRVSMLLSQWYERQLVQPQLYPAPDFCSTLDAIENEGHWKPETPPSFLNLLGLSALAAPAPAPPARAPAAATPRAPPAARAPAPSPAAAGGPYLNTAFNPIFQPYKDSSVTCRELRGRIGTGENPLPPLPLSRVDNLAMCLAFHAKGMCNPMCGRIADHVPYTASQYAPLLAWCQECYTV